jgi:hypothetical protein
MGVDARPEGPLASLSHVTKGELCREQALVSWCSRLSDTQTRKFPAQQASLEHARPPAGRRAAPALPRGEAAVTAPLIAPLIPPRARPGAQEHGRAAPARRLPMAVAPDVPAVPRDVVYGTGRIDESGRVARTCGASSQTFRPPRARNSPVAAAAVVVRQSRSSYQSICSGVPAGRKSAPNTRRKAGFGASRPARIAPTMASSPSS